MAEVQRQQGLQELSHDTLSQMFLSVVDRHGNNVAYRHFIGSSDSLANVTYEKFYKPPLEDEYHRDCFYF